MKIVITGASGNVGTALLRALGDEPQVTRIVGLARRLPSLELQKVERIAADVVDSPLEQIFRGADAVVHLAWAIQPTRDRRTLVQINVTGSRRVFEAAAAAGVGKLVYASSVGSYSPGPKEARVDERWPTNGIASSYYSRDKAATEHMLDRLERERPELQIVRMRPGVVMQREAASEIRRLFLGPFVPVSLARPELIPVLPLPSGLRIQAVHAHDLADAYRRVIVSPEAQGAYNVAAEPVLTAAAFAQALSAIELPVPAGLARAAVNLSWLARVQPINSGWLDMGLRAPVMNTTRIREELGWAPQHDALSTLEELLDGLRSGDGFPTPPLDPATSGPGRIREILQSMVIATHDVTATNRMLETRLKETRGEIETLRETLEAVRVEALTDSLTGIANRKHFEEMLAKSIDHAVVQRTPLALVVLDIDHFKRFNDTYGHLTGDQVLRLVSMTMRENVKAKATVARFGGEEFGVVLPDTTLETAYATAEQIRQSVMARELVKRSTGESLGKVTVSVGVAAFRKGDTGVSLLERADQCMYAAKRMGRNRTLTDGDCEGGLHDVA